MNIAILSLTVCKPTENVIRYFVEKGLPIKAVIIETNVRHKFSEREIAYRRAHDMFNRKTKKYRFVRRVARRLWDWMPLPVRAFVLRNIYYLPVVNRFSIRRFCEKNQISVFEVLKHSSEETKQILQNAQIDYLLMVSSHWLLKEPLLSLPNTQIINAHSGWLPKHKGLDSIPWSLKEQDKVGLTTHFIDSGIDSGAILRFYEADVERGDDLNAITRKVGCLQPWAFYDTLLGLRDGEITPVPQDDTYRPHAPMSFKELWQLNQTLKI